MEGQARRTRQGVKTREEGENVDWPQIESHPFITPGLVRSATLLPPRPLVPSDRGQKSGTRSRSLLLLPCPFIGRRFGASGNRQRAANQIRGTEGRVSCGKGPFTPRAGGCTWVEIVYWSWCTPWQMDELFSAASRVLRQM